MTLEIILIIGINLVILIIGYWRFKVKLEVEMAKMNLRIHQNTKDIEMNQEKFTEELKELAKERKEDNGQNAKEHKEMVTVLHKIDMTVARIDTKVAALKK